MAVNVSVDGHQEMVGFEVSISGRFWVSTEDRGAVAAEPSRPAGERGLPTVTLR